MNHSTKDTNTGLWHGFVISGMNGLIFAAECVSIKHCYCYACGIESA